MNPLLTPSMVLERLGNPDTVILDATLPPVGISPKIDTHARYLTAHLPGAVFFDIEALSDRSTSLPHMLASPQQFSLDMSQLGVADDAFVVVYEQAEVFSAPRAWWMLRSMGARQVYVLEGGLRAWTEMGLPVESGAVRRAPAEFHAHLQPEAVKDYAQMQEILGSSAKERGMQVLDARSTGRFEGSAPEPRPGISSGHMPGAISVPYTELIQGSHVKAPGELREIFSARGIDLQQPITTTCGSGVTAAVISLALEICGASDVSLYDGSWAEYAQRAESCIERNA